jgi:hypothetical protein
MSQFVIWAFFSGLACWPLWRLFNPWRCAGCSYTTYSAERMFNHIEAKHVHKKRGK